MRLSFIVIGMNEGRTLHLCLDSIFNYVKKNGIKDFEVIYVDSKSADSSVQIACSYAGVKTYLIDGDINAAIARNIGGIEATGDVFFFLDGDMEIEANFHEAIFEGGILEHEFISGQLQNIYYDADGNCVDQNYLFPGLLVDQFEATSGGYFVITSDCWRKTGGMRTKYKRSQDLDFALSLANKGILLKRKSELFVRHHTIDYLHRSRAWKMLIDGSLLYGTSLLYRDHFLNKYIFRIIARRDYTLLILAMLFLMSYFLPVWVMLIYLFAVVIRSMGKKKIAKSIPTISVMVFQVAKDLFTLVGFFCFFPKSKPIVYHEVV